MKPKFAKFLDIGVIGAHRQRSELFTYLLRRTYRSAGDRRPKNSNQEICRISCGYPCRAGASPANCPQTCLGELPIALLRLMAVFFLTHSSSERNGSNHLCF